MAKKWGFDYDLWSSDNFWNDLDGFSNQLNNLPLEDRPSAISDWINENFDEDGKLWRYQEIRENINLSFDLNGIIDFSSNDGNDKEIRVHYSVESEYLSQPVPPLFIRYTPLEIYFRLTFDSKHGGCVATLKLLVAR